MDLPHSSHRVAARAVIVEGGRLLLVNAWSDHRHDLWCAPGGGVETGQSLTEALVREVHEECGLVVAPGLPCLVNEFHAPDRGFHQLEVFFRCRLVSGSLDETWADPEGVVTKRRFFSPEELTRIRLKPDSLPRVAFTDDFDYDALEEIVR